MGKSPTICLGKDGSSSDGNVLYLSSLDGKFLKFYAYCALIVLELYCMQAR